MPLDFIADWITRLDYIGDHWGNQIGFVVIFGMFGLFVWAFTMAWVKDHYTLTKPEEHAEWICQHCGHRYTDPAATAAHAVACH